MGCPWSRLFTRRGNKRPAAEVLGEWAAQLAQLRELKLAAEEEFLRSNDPEEQMALHANIQELEKEIATLNDGHFIAKTALNRASAVGRSAELASIVQEAKDIVSEIKVPAIDSQDMDEVVAGLEDSSIYRVENLGRLKDVFAGIDAQEELIRDRQRDLVIERRRKDIMSRLKHTSTDPMATTRQKAVLLSAPHDVFAIPMAPPPEPIAYTDPEPIAYTDPDEDEYQALLAHLWPVPPKSPPNPAGGGETIQVKQKKKQKQVQLRNEEYV